MRIPFATLDSLVDLLAEMVIARGRLAEALRHTRPLRRGGDEGRAAWSEADEAHERLEGVLEELQQGVLRLRMVPLGSVFRQLGRIVHDTAAQEGKRVRLLVEGGDTAIDKALLELAGEAMGHLVRNAIIHGIEEPAERRRGGKDESGTLRLAGEPLLHGQPGVGEIFSMRSRKTPYWLNADQRRVVRKLRARGAGPTWFCDADDAA